MQKKYNKNLLYLIKHYNSSTEEIQEGKSKGVILEGSSRSGKTWASIDFIIYLCAKHDESITIHIIKETYNSFKTTLYDDFNKRLPMYGLDNPFARSKEVASFKILNHTVHLIGADKDSKAHGSGCDYAWFNEALDVKRPVFDQKEMRTKRFWWSDYNPSASVHYVYDNVIPRDDVEYLKTTFLDNPFISASEKKKILSYEPTPNNKKQGTADDYMWNVYGLGLKMSRTGLVFQNVTWVDEFPTEIERIAWGLDFGYTTDPSALVRIGVNGNDMYVQELVYEPTKNADVLYPLVKASIGTEHPNIFCDSADPGMISDLRNKGLKVFAVKKFHGSIKYGVGLMNSYNLHFVKSKNLKKEQENYAYREINGIPLDEPIDGFNHIFDASRYACISNFRKK